MSNFSDILKKGKKQFQVKDQLGKWGRCDYCDERRLLFTYSDSKSEFWYLCESCSDVFIKEEE